MFNSNLPTDRSGYRVSGCALNFSNMLLVLHVSPSEIEPSKFEIEVEQIKNWTRSANKSSLSECLEYTTGIAELLARERYHMIVRDDKEDSEMKSVGEQPKEERRVESGEELHTKHVVADQVRLLCFYSETRLFMNDLKRIHTFNAHFIVLT